MRGENLWRDALLSDIGPFLPASVTDEPDRKHVIETRMDFDSSAHGICLPVEVKKDTDLQVTNLQVLSGMRDPTDRDEQSRSGD